MPGINPFILASNPKDVLHIMIGALRSLWQQKIKANFCSKSWATQMHDWIFKQLWEGKLTSILAKKILKLVVDWFLCLLSAKLCYFSCPPWRSSLVKMLSIIPWNLACLKTNSNSRFFSMLWNPFHNCCFFITLWCILFFALAKWIKPRTCDLCNCSWHVHRVTHYRCTTGSQLCSNLALHDSCQRRDSLSLQICSYRHRH